MINAFWPTLWHNLVHFGAPSTPVSLVEKVVRPVVVYVALVVWLKRWGKRILAQLNPFDFVLLLMLSNTVQNAIIGNDTSLTGGLLGAAALLTVNWVLVWYYYRGPSIDRLFREDGDMCLIDGGRVEESDLARLHISRGELIAKAHERGFDDLDEIDHAVLYPNGTIYFRGRRPDEAERRHRELMEGIEHIQRELAGRR
ncbi:MAG TPA: YetF domain-containing protein [Gemmatimonadales bacterium]|nr:YetF domain-containing protein [Gemmatimonadales bacterium]